MNRSCKFLITAICIISMTFTYSYGEERYSLQLTKFLEFVQKYYFEPNRLDYDEYSRLFPAMVACVIGHALGQQFQYIKYESHQKTYDELKTELRDYYKDLVERIGGISGSSGLKVDVDLLMYTTLTYSLGEGDDKIPESFNVQWDKQRSFFAWKEDEFPEFTVSYMPQFKKKNDTAVLPPVESDSIVILDKPVVERRQPPERLPPDDQSRFNPDVIVGVWEGKPSLTDCWFNEECTIRISIQSAAKRYYASVISYPKSYGQRLPYGCVPNDVCYDIKFEGFTQGIGGMVPYFKCGKKKWHQRNGQLISEYWEEDAFSYNPNNDQVTFGKGGGMWMNRVR